MNTERQQISSVSKIIFLMIASVDLVAILFLSWQVYYPERWLPLPPPEVLLPVVLVVNLFWFLKLMEVSVIGNK